MNWIEKYDQDTYMQPYASIQYNNYNPLAQQQQDTPQDDETLPLKPFFSQNYSFELTV